METGHWSFYKCGLGPEFQTWKDWSLFGVQLSNFWSFNIDPWRLFDDFLLRLKMICFRIRWTSKSAHKKTELRFLGLALLWDRHRWTFVLKTFFSEFVPWWSLGAVLGPYLRLACAMPWGMFAASQLSSMAGDAVVAQAAWQWAQLKSDSDGLDDP